MGITLTCNLDNHGVFFAGEKLSCSVTFKNSYASSVAGGLSEDASSPPNVVHHPDDDALRSSGLSRRERDYVRRSHKAAASIGSSIELATPKLSSAGDSGSSNDTHEATDAERTFAKGHARMHSFDAPTHSESLLWAFIQLVGSFVPDDATVDRSSFVNLDTSGLYAGVPVAMPGSTGLVGGPISPPSSGHRANGGMGGGMIGRQPGVLVRGRTGSDNSGLDGAVGKKKSNTTALVAGREIVVGAEAKMVPVFTTPPTIVLCDLALKPGQSKTYAYEIVLPDSLPPTHRGHSIRVAYRLVITTQHGAPDRPPRIAHVPFRVFNRVAPDGSRPPHDLMRPTSMKHDRAIVVDRDKQVSLTSTSGPARPIPRRMSTFNPEGRARFLRSVYDAVKRDQEARELMPYSPTDIVHLPLGLADAGTSLRHSTLWCQKSRPATYNMSHANKHVARLRLPRSNYKLGESISGVLDLSGAELACYHVSLTLESLERVEPDFALMPMRQIMRMSARRHADIHLRCHGQRRVGFELWAPSWATPDFETTVGRSYFISHGWQLRLQFIVGPTVLKPERIRSAAVGGVGSESWSGQQVPEEVAVDGFECCVPLRMYCCGYAAGRMYPEEHIFAMT